MRKKKVNIFKCKETEFKPNRTYHSNSEHCSHIGNNYCGKCLL